MWVTGALCCLAVGAGSEASWAVGAEGVGGEVASPGGRGTEAGGAGSRSAGSRSAGVGGWEVRSWTLREAQVALRFNRALLADLGVELAAVEQGGDAGWSASVEEGDGAQRDGLYFASVAPFGLGFTTKGGGFGDFAGGALRMRGGFGMRWEDGEVSLAGFAVRPGEAPRSLEIVDAAGRALLLADGMHVWLDPDGTVRITYMDVRLSPLLARWMGRPLQAGLGVAALELRAASNRVVKAEGVPVGCTDPDWLATVDVALLDIPSVGQTVREPGVRVAVTPAASLSNVGTADVPWYNRFSAPKPPYNNDQHPFLVWAMYRLLDGRLEPLARSPLKHAFATINAGCPPCEPGHILWAGTGAAGHPNAGCTDVYAKTTNENRNLLGPRSEVTASTGVWQRCGSIFDPDCDDVMDFPPVTGDFDRRMAVPEAALGVPGALYFVDSWYVVRDDVDIFNSMGYRQVDPVLDGNVWSFGLVGGYVQGPVADAWVDPQAPGRDALNQRLDTGEGWVQLAVRTSYLGGGVYRYDYALVNHDFDRQLASLVLPLAAGAGVTAASFTDADEDPANDWAASVVGDTLVWQAPDAAAAADWGTLLSFSFQSATPPALAMADLAVAEAGDPASLTIPTLAPGIAELFADGFEGGTTAAWSATVP